MKPLDKHNLFSIFQAGDEEVYREHNLEDTLKNPYVLMGMVLRGLQNYELMDMMYTRSYPKEYAEIAKKIQHKYFTTLYTYLTRIDSTKFETVYTIGESFHKQDVLIGLTDLLDFFVEVEEYEKCAVIKRYIDLLCTKEVVTMK